MASETQHAGKGQPPSSDDVSASGDKPKGRHIPPPPGSKAVPAPGGPAARPSRPPPPLPKARSAQAENPSQPPPLPIPPVPTPALERTLAKVVVTTEARPSSVPLEERVTAAPPRPAEPRRTDILAGAAPSDRPPPPHTRDTAARELIADCTRKLERPLDSLHSARLHYEIARQYEHPLGLLAEAVEHYQKAHSLARQDLTIIRGLRRVLLARGAHKDAVALFDAEARLSSDVGTKARLLLAKGRLLEDSLQQPAEAREAYRSAVTLDASDLSVLRAAEQSAMQADDWAQLSRTLERAANLHASVEQRASLLVQRGNVLETRLGQPDLAVEQYEAALEADPSCMRAIVALKRLYHARGRLRDRVRMLELEAERSNDRDVQTASLYEASRLYSDRLGNRRGAIEALERALALCPDDPLLLDELGRLLEEEHDWEGVVRTLARRVKTAGDRDSVPLIHRLGQLCQDRLHDEAAAVGWFERALAQDATYAPALQGLAPLYLRGEQYEELIQMHLREADATGDSEKRAAAHARVARLCEEQLNDSARAVSQHGRALAAVELYPASFRALTRLYSTMGRWAELAELYERAVEAADDGATVLHLLRIGAIHEEHLADPVQALHAYRRALDLDADNLQAIQSLARVAESAGRYADLVEALELEAAQANDPARTVGLLHRAGEVLDERLHDRERAVETLRRVLALDAEHAPSLASLGRIYYRAGRWEQLRATYETELSLAKSDEQACRLHLKLGELCERHLASHDQATVHYRAACELTPTDTTATEALGRKLREQSAWPELLKLWDRAAEHLETPRGRALAHFRRGELLEAHLGRVDSALSAYEDALAQQSDYRPALSALARLRFTRGEWQELATQLDEDAARLTDPRQQVTALSRASALYRDQLRDPDRALAGFSKVLELDPRHPEALSAVEQLARQRQDPQTLMQVLHTQAHALADPAAKAMALRELARAQSSNAGHEALRTTLASLLSVAPGDPHALDMLEALALKTADAALLQQIDESRIAHSTSPTERAAHRTRLAESIEEGDPARALTLYRDALDDDSENLAAVRGLSRLAEQSGQPDLLTQAAAKEADVLGDQHKAALLLVQSGATRLGSDDLPDAVRDLERALELDPDCAAAAHHLRDALTRTDDLPRLTQQLNRAATTCQDDAHASRLWRESARIAADQQHDVPAAISALRRALRRAPDDAESLRMLAGVLEQDGHWNEAVQHYERLLEACDDDETVVSARMKLAQLYEQRAKDETEAIKQLRLVLERAPGHREALRQLSDILSRKDASGEEAAEVVMRLVETAESSRTRVAALLQLARVEARRQQHDAASMALIEAVAIEGPESASGAAFRDAVGSVTTWHQYAIALERHVAAHQSYRGAPHNGCLALARVRAHQLRDVQGGIDALRTGLELNPDHAPLRIELSGLLQAAGQNADAAEMLRAALSADTERAQTWRDLGNSFQALGKHHAVGFTQDALVVLGAANKAERNAVTARAARPCQAQPGALSPQSAPELSAGLSPPGAAAELLAVLSEGLGKLYPPKLEEFGVSARNRLTNRSEHPLRLLADRIAVLVGAPEFDLYLHSARGRGVGIELTSPVSILLPQSLEEEKETAQVFVIGQLLALLAAGAHPVYTLTPRELEVLLASYARNIAPQFGEGLTSEDVMNDQARRMHRALPRRARKSAEELAREYVQAPIAAFADWVRDRERAANRVGALLADNLPAVAERLSLTRAAPGEDEPPTLTDLENGALTDVLHFWVAEPTLALRRRAGLPRADEG